MEDPVLQIDTDWEFSHLFSLFYPRRCLAARLGARGAMKRGDDVQRPDVMRQRVLR